MATYRLRLKKEQREEVKQEYPGLAHSPVYLTVTKFDLDTDLTTATDRQIETLLQKILGDVNREEINPEYKIKEREEVVLIPRYDSHDKIFEKEIQIPEHLQDE